MKKVVGYVRVSTDVQRENTSTDEQKDRIEAYCKSQNWSLIKIYNDAGYSGSHTDRPEYQEMLQFMNENPEEVDVVLVLKMDRIHRNQLNLLKFINEDLAKLKIDFVSTTESFDTSTPIGRMMLSILAVFAEFERERISERMHSGRVSTANKQKRAGGMPPYGYRITESGKIGVCVEQVTVVRRIYKDYVMGLTAYGIAKQLNAEGILPVRGLQWRPNNITNILTNETYTGVNYYDGKKERNGIKQKGVFPKIISRTLFNKVARRMEQNKAI